MDAFGALRSSLGISEFLVNSYLADLSDQDCLLRPAPGANHILWQLGHLVAAEHGLVEACVPGSMPPLPADFAGKYTAETASSDNLADFHSKSELLELFTKQRQGTLAALSKLSAADLDQPAPEKFRSRFPTVGDVLTLVGLHPTMHSGQWVVVRRTLGKKAMF